MSTFYTSVIRDGGKILVCGYQDGKRFLKKVKYKPYLFIPTKNEKSRYKTIYGEPVERLDFDDIWDAYNFQKQYEDVENFQVYGLTDYPYTYINDNFKGAKPKAEDIARIKVCVIDIEVDISERYPTIELADNAITAITMLYKDITIAFGLGDFTPKDKKVKYSRCKDESDLLKKFLNVWSSDVFRPDVVTGWNIEAFDIPYIVNRIKRILGDGEAERLSPWGLLTEKRFTGRFGKEVQSYIPHGVNILDYFELYKKFTYSSQESYSLNHISFVELGEKKTDYSEYENLTRLYRENHQLFMEYNVRDCELVWRIDQKMRLLDLVYEFAYDSGTNFADALKPVITWDVIIHNYLLERNVVVPPKKETSKDLRPRGGYVKTTRPGMYHWVVSFDLQSLYPHLIMGHNISPEVYRGKLRDNLKVSQYLEGIPKGVWDFITETNVSLCGNNCYYDRTRQGFMGALMDEYFAKRAAYKKQMIEVEKEYERTKDASLKNEISRLDNLQKGIKIKLNSAYGAFLNVYFRWFSLDLAESITVSGQLVIQWANDWINAFLNDKAGTKDVDYIIASDTDSCYIDMGAVVAKLTEGKTITTAETVDLVDRFCKAEVQVVLGEAFKTLTENMNCYRQAMYMKRETIADRGVYTAKKRYVLNVWDKEGVRYKEPKLKLTGIEAVRSTTSAVCQDAIKKALQVVITKDEAAAQKFIDDFRQEFLKLPVEAIGQPSGMNGLEKYADTVTGYRKRTPMHVKGSIIYNRVLNEMGLANTFAPIFDREKVKCVRLKMPNPVREKVICFPSVLPKQFGLDKYIDRHLQFDVTFLEPFKRILTAIGWQHEKIHTVKKFFKKKTT